MRYSVVIAVLAAFLFAGVGAGAQQNLWQPLNDVGTPSVRFEFAFASDPQADLFVLFGGQTASAFTIFDETWIYDGAQTWTQLNLATRPSNRTATYMSFDSVRGVFVLFGGQSAQTLLLNDTWEFDGTAWSQVAVAAAPPPRQFHSMTFDAGSGETFVFGGGVGFLAATNDLWSFDGTTWTNRTPISSPSARQTTQLVYDAGRDVLVLFGGGTNLFNPLNDTWEFSSSTNTWTQITTPTSPPARRNHAMAYDAERGVVVMYGGNDSAMIFEDTWEYDGTNWVEVTSFLTPGPRNEARFAPASNGLILHGSPFANDSWRYRGTPSLFPGTASDCAIAVSENGGPFGLPTDPIGLAAGDHVALNCQSPGGTLNNASFALVGSSYVQGNAPAGLSLVSGTSPDVWVDPTSAFVLLDGLAGVNSIFAPVLAPGGAFVGPFTIPVGWTGFAFNLQLFVSDPMANPVGIATSDAITLEFQ